MNESQTKLTANKFYLTQTKSTETFFLMKRKFFQSLD